MSWAERKGKKAKVNNQNVVEKQLGTRIRGQGQQTLTGAGKGDAEVCDGEQLRCVDAISS